MVISFNTYFLIFLVHVFGVEETLIDTCVEGSLVHVYIRYMYKNIHE